jgi:hypothetical protein
MNAFFNGKVRKLLYAAMLLGISLFLFLGTNSVSAARIPEILAGTPTQNSETGSLITPTPHPIIQETPLVENGDHRSNYQPDFISDTYPIPPRFLTLPFYKDLIHPIIMGDTWIRLNSTPHQGVDYFRADSKLDFIHLR